MKAQVTAIAIMALMALSTPGTMADSTAPGTESDAQCLLKGELVEAIYVLLPEVITLDEDPRDIVCELDDGTVLECEDLGDNLYSCVMGDGELGCTLDECEDAICVAEGGDVWTCTGSEDPCPNFRTCVPDPCENPDDCNVGPIPSPCQGDDCTFGATSAEGRVKLCEGVYGKPVLYVGGANAADSNGFTLWASPHVTADPEGWNELAWAGQIFDIYVEYWMTDSPSGLGASDVHGIGGAVQGTSYAFVNGVHTFSDGIHPFIVPGQSAGCAHLGTYYGDFSYSIVGGYMAFSGSLMCGLNVEIGWPTNVEFYCEATVNFDWATRFSRFNEFADMSPYSALF